jgi:DNA-binding CsgD family transcriptional regulator
MPFSPSPDDHPVPVRQPAEPLTRREHEVLARIAAGSPNATIAEALGVELATVKSHISRLYRKLGVANRVEATRYYLAHRDDLGGPLAPERPVTATSRRGERPGPPRPGEPTAQQVDAQLRELRDEAERLRRRLDALREPATRHGDPA